jgi:putative tryptophan/tyrosine transport system substrate-binding protein
MSQGNATTRFHQSNHWISRCLAARGSRAVGRTALHPVTRSVPVVFVLVVDPVGAGFAESLARPGGNITGFTQFEFSIGAKWLELLKRIAPQVTVAGIIRDATLTAGTAMFAAFKLWRHPSA